MKQKLIFIFLSSALLIISLGGVMAYRLFATVKITAAQAVPPDHEPWEALLKAYVTNGHVDYTRLHKNNGPLNAYLEQLQDHVPSSAWSREEQLAYWINAYNAYTIKLILEHYPVESIKDIGGLVQIPLVNSTWDIAFIQIGDRLLSLNDIEHRILRQEFSEPRIHFAIVCASVSCPALAREAYLPEKIEAQLEAQTAAFINDQSKNIITTNHIRISKIFDWFNSDFTGDGGLIEFLNQYSQTKIKPEAQIEYLDYDWSLNN
jgi:hypothetical protein